MFLNRFPWYVSSAVVLITLFFALVGFQTTKSLYYETIINGQVYYGKCVLKDYDGACLESEPKSVPLDKRLKDHIFFAKFYSIFGTMVFTLFNSSARAYYYARKPKDD